MSQTHPTTTGLKVRHFDTDEVYFLLSERFRVQMIRALSDGQMRTAVNLNGASGRKRHAYTRHIAALCKGGLLVKKDNPNNGREPLYGLSPHAVLCRTDRCTTVDFGCAMLRFNK